MQPTYEKFQQNIFIQSNSTGSLTFMLAIENDLRKIASQPVGARLLEKIKQGAHPVFIHYHTEKWTSKPYSHENKCKKGVGCSTTVFACLSDKTRIIDYTLAPCQTPSYISLAHELIHAYHNSYGRNRQNHPFQDTEIWKNAEEYNTIVGYPSKKPRFSNLKITENNIRKEHSLPLRLTHLSELQRFTTTMLAQVRIYQFAAATLKHNFGTNYIAHPKALIRLYTHVGCIKIKYMNLQ